MIFIYWLRRWILTKFHKNYKLRNKDIFYSASTYWLIRFSFSSISYLKSFYSMYMLWLFEFMQITLNCLLFLTLYPYVMGYASQITISSATASTISNFYQDFSTCSCDKTPSLCDNYCCCDSACSSVIS